MDKKAIDLTAPEYYQNRETSWLDFNERVIAEALDDSNPLLEQLFFLAIGSSNLDEFMQIRVAGLVDQYIFGANGRDTKKGWTPEKQLRKITKKNRKIVARQYEIYHQKMAEVEALGYRVEQLENITAERRREIQDILKDQIAPVISPYGVDAYRPFPFIHDGQQQIFVHLEKDQKDYTVIIPITPLLNRYFILEKDEQGVHPLVFVEDLIPYYMDELFIGYKVVDTFTFRVTRNADLELHEKDADDLLHVIEDYIECRRNGMAIRLEIDARNQYRDIDRAVDFLLKELDLPKEAVYFIDGPLDLTFLFKLKDELAKKFPMLAYPTFKPYYPAFLKQQSIFEAAKTQDLYFHHPYDSFDPIVEFIQKAATDSNTVSIKMTLYRVSDDSKLVHALLQASRSGIQVTVLMELKARFDEENNVNWAKELEDAGVHILYGMRELKTHSKIAMVTKKVGQGFKRYVHLGTGNYHEKTAKQYTDMGIITSNELIGQDATDFFNYLSGYSQQPDYHYLYVSPNNIRDAFMNKIDREISHQKEHKNGHIIIKMNSFTDPILIRKIYEASQAGVKIEFIIRGICCLIPGLPGVSENITVRSIVGRFLEHSRVYYFHNNEQEELYLSSADMMTRNMVNRVEIAFPVLDENIKNIIFNTLQLFLADNTKAWELHSDEIYRKLTPHGKNAINAQEELMRIAAEKRKQERDASAPLNKNWFQRLKKYF